MNFEQAKERAGAHTWWSEDAPGRYQYVDWWLSAFVEQRMYFHPDLLSVIFVSFTDGFLGEKTPSDERLQIYDWMKARYQDDHRFLDQEYDQWAPRRNAALDAMYRHIAALPEMSQKEWFSRYIAVYRQATDVVRGGVFLENADDYNTLVLPQVMEQLFPEMDQNDRNEIMITMSSPVIVSFMEEFQAEKAELVLEHRDAIESVDRYDELPRETQQALEMLAYEYRWMSVNYAGTPPLVAETLFRELQDQAHHQNDNALREDLLQHASKIDRLVTAQARIEVEHVIPQMVRDDFSIMRALGAWIDDRKHFMVQGNYFIFKSLECLAALTGVNQNLLSMYSMEELQLLCEKGEVADEKVVRERNSNAVYAAEYRGDGESEVTVFLGDEAEELKKVLNPHEERALSGIVASTGGLDEFIGNVQVVVDVSKAEFQRGNILVTTMTRPEFVPLMKKASAIITDEGGITSHAAVISRELGIPCIIGARRATKELSTGDQVRLDLKTGRVVGE